MDATIRNTIRHIFLSPRPSFALMTVASLLGMTFEGLKREIESGAIVAVSTRLGWRVAREEVVAAAVLPEVIRLVELRAQVPRYQKEMLHYLARRNGTSVDRVLALELEDLACSHAAELTTVVPGFSAALAWPEKELGN